MAWSLSAKVSLASNAVMLGVVALAWLGVPSTAPLPYAWHKALHVAGVVIFFGNLVAGPLWLAFAWYDEGRRHLAFAARTLAQADLWLTTPGVQLAGWNGLFLAAALGGARKYPWLVESLALMVVTSALSVGLVLPWQERFIDAAVRQDEAAIRRALVRWSVWGTLVTVPLTLVAWLMIAKRGLLL